MPYVYFGKSNRIITENAGTLPEDFDYKKELEEAREAKYAHFI